MQVQYFSHSKSYPPAIPNKLQFLKEVKDIITLKDIVVVSPNTLSSIYFFEEGRYVCDHV